MRWLGVVALGLALTGCAAGGESGGQMTWMRADGRPVDAGFKTAANQCREAATRAGAGAPRREREEAMMAAMESCMQRRGYVWRCESPLGELAPGACAEGGTPAGKGPRPARSAAPGASMT